MCHFRYTVIYSPVAAMAGTLWSLAVIHAHTLTSHKILTLHTNVDWAMTQRIVWNKSPLRFSSIKLSISSIATICLQVSKWALFIYVYLSLSNSLVPFQIPMPKKASATLVHSHLSLFNFLMTFPNMNFRNTFHKSVVFNFRPLKLFQLNSSDAIWCMFYTWE